MEILHLFLLFLALIFVINLLFKKPKNLPPSPPSLPIHGHLHLLKTPHYRSLFKIYDKYGPIVSLRFGSRPVLLVSSPSLAEECFTKNDIIFANRPRLLLGKHMGYNNTTLISSSYGHNWRFLRRITTLEMLSPNRVQMFSSIRRDEVISMIKRLLGSRFESGEYEYRKVDMKKTFFELTLNVMMRMIAGKTYCGVEVKEMEEAKRFREMVEESAQLCAATNIGDYLEVFRWLGFNGFEKKILILKDKRDVVLDEMIEELRTQMSVKNGKYREDITELTMIEVLLSLQQNEPENYTDQMIKGLVWVLLGTGTDTATGTMEWAMSLLVNNPEVLKKAQTEIDVNVGRDRLLTESDLANLPYLHNIIMETLRLYPAAPLLPHASSKECSVGGYKIPSGTMLLVNLWSIHNDPKLWHEPRKFKPERFEGLKGERDGFKLMPFGSGRRGCPGEGLAMRVVGLALGCLIQCFEWEKVGEEMVDMTEGFGLSLPKAQPLEVKFRPHPNMIDFLTHLVIVERH